MNRRASWPKGNLHHVRRMSPLRHAPGADGKPSPGSVGQPRKRSSDRRLGPYVFVAPRTRHVKMYRFAGFKALPDCTYSTFFVHRSAMSLLRSWISR